MVSELTARRNQAFAGATSVAYPVLDEDYVAYLLERLGTEGFTALPSHEVAVSAFRTLGNQPEGMTKALRQLHFHLPAGANTDEYLPVIANTLRSASADVELMKLEQLGGVATASSTALPGLRKAPEAYSRPKRRRSTRWRSGAR